jgi:hypothetical protein
MLLLISDPDPGFGASCALTSGSGFRIRDGEISESGIRDEHLGSYFRELINNFLGLKILKFFDTDPGPF